MKAIKVDENIFRMFMRSRVGTEPITIDVFYGGHYVHLKIGPDGAKVTTNCPERLDVCPNAVNPPTEEMLTRQNPRRAYTRTRGRAMAKVANFGDVEGAPF